MGPQERLPQVKISGLCGDALAHGWRRALCALLLGEYADNVRARSA